MSLACAAVPPGAAMTFPVVASASVWSTAAQLAGPLSGERRALGRLPVAAVNRGGQSLVAWTEQGRSGVFAAVGDARGRFGHAVQLSRTGVTRAAAIADDGTAIVLWEDAGPSLMAAVRSPGGRWGRPERISGTGRGLFFEPVIAFNRRGSAIVAWALAIRGRESPVQVVTRPVGGAFGSPSTIGTGGSVHLALNARGDTVASWTHVVETGGTFPVPYSRTSVAQVAVRRAGHRFAAPVTVSTTPTYATRGAMSGDGTVAVSWERANGPESDPYGAIQTSFQGASRAFETPVDAPFARASRSFWPRIASGSRGEFVTAWQEKAQGTTSTTAAPIYWATRRPGGAFGRRRTMTPSAVSAPQFARTDDGRALVVWTERRFGAALYRSGSGFVRAAAPAGTPAPAAQSLAAAGDFAVLAWQTDARRLMATVRRP